MINFSISFDNSWVLLFLIPVIFCTLFPYFRMSKRYRYTRNRISSMTLHLIVMLASILVLAGTVVSYDKKNYENEVILLVDLSFSNEENKTLKDSFVEDAINNAYVVFKLGVVTFGYDQVYASKLSYDKEDTYKEYLNAEMPNTSATDIASALTYTKDLFTFPESGKIVLMTDGIETDGNALNVISAIALEGIQVDTVYFGNMDVSNEIQLIDSSLPDYNVGVGDVCSIGLTLQSTFTGAAVLNLYDNGELSASYDVVMTEGISYVSLDYQFMLPGLHKLSFEIVAGEDTLLQNNVYYSYLYLAIYDKILIVENTNEGDYLAGLLWEDFDITQINIDEIDSYDLTNVDNLREFDQVILLNISDEDIQTRAVGFDITLNQYVYIYGGGLLTAGGEVSDDDDVNAYNREDLYGTLLQNMLPVTAVDYTPPLGVVFVIDKSGSMGTTESSTGFTYLELAKEAAITGLNCLTERDYCGVISLETEYTTDVSMVSATQKYRVEEAISLIEKGGGTNYAGALDRAAQALLALDAVSKRHIVLISDGYPSDESEAIEIAETIAEKGITISTFTMGSSITSVMQSIAEIGMGDRTEVGSYCLSGGTSLSENLRNDLFVDAIKEVEYDEYQPTFGTYSQVLDGIIEEDLPSLYGYYGTSAKSGATVSLYGEYVPIYAYWDYGEGSVGSFMCDLSGYWSADFLTDETGIRFIKNVIYSLFPTEDISAQEIVVTISQNNYSNTASIYTPLEEGETIELIITSPSVDMNQADTVQVIQGDSTTGFSRISYSLTVAGVHNITVNKLSETGEVIATYTTEQTFSYSQEYNPFLSAEDGLELISSLAELGDGNLLVSYEGIFDELITDYTTEYDLRIPLMILAIVLFLLDVAVRKFKFKWPHEIIKEHKAKKVELKK